MDSKKVYFISGGGTGGHIYPAIAVINELKKKGINDIYYIGNPKNPEFILAKDNHINFLPVDINAMPRKISLASIVWVIKLIIAICLCTFYILKYKPKVVFGTGGYVSAPILFASRLLKVPYALHDADAKPGIVTTCFASGAIVLTTPFEKIKSVFPNANVKITGNPIREEFSAKNKPEAKQQMGLEDKITILVMGGSQGARSINNALVPIAKKIIEEFNVTILHQSGKKRYEEVIAELKTDFPDYKDNKNYKLFPYIDNMPALLNSADIAISRSGSLSLSEMKAAGVASVLIPYPYSAGNHQKINAEAMVEEGCSIMIEDFDLTPEKLYNTLAELLSDSDKMKSMQKKAEETSRPDATQIIAENLINS